MFQTSPPLDIVGVPTFPDVKVRKTRFLASALRTPPHEVTLEDSASVRGDRSRSSSSSSSSSAYVPIVHPVHSKPPPDSLQNLLDSTLKHCSAIFYDELTCLKHEVEKLKKDKKKIQQEWFSLRYERDSAVNKVRMLENEIKANAGLYSGPHSRPATPSILDGVRQVYPSPQSDPKALVSESDRSSSPHPAAVKAQAPLHTESDSSPAPVETVAPPATPIEGTSVVPASCPIPSPAQREATAEAEAQDLFRRWDLAGEAFDMSIRSPTLHVDHVSIFFYRVSDKYFCKRCLATTSVDREDATCRREDAESPSTSMNGVLKHAVFTSFGQSLPEEAGAADEEADPRSPSELPTFTLGDLLRHCVFVHPKIYSKTAGLELEETYRLWQYLRK